MSKTTELKKLEINSFKRINPDAPVIIDFGNDNNVVTFSGNQGVGKTTMIEAIMFLMGETLDIAKENLPNTSTGKIDMDLEFEHNSKKFKVSVTKSQFKLAKLWVDGEDEKWVEETSPKEVLKKIFNKALVPASIRYENGTKQVEWVTKLFPLPKEADEAIKSASLKIKQLVEERPRIGKQRDAEKAVLNSNPLWAEYQQKGEELEKEIKKLEKASDKFDVAEVTSKYNQYKSAESTLAELKSKLQNEESDLAELNRQISDLQVKAGLKESSISETKERIVKGEDFIAKNKKSLTDYEKAMEAQKEASSVAIRIDTFKNMLSVKSKYDEFETAYVNIDSKIVDLKKVIQEVKNEYLPTIEDVEVVTDEFDEDKKLGIYYNDKPLQLASESEYTTALIKILKASGSRFVFLENITSFGSGTIEFLNELAKDLNEQGGYIFCSQMDRTSEEIHITLDKKLE